MLQGLYALTDATLTPDETLFEHVTQAILGGTRLVQLRDKTRSDTQLYAIALALQELCTAHQVIFIIDDRLTLAQKINADGLHIGRDDLDFRIARAEFPNKILGMSCYGNPDDALIYQDQGADYVAFGAFFKSPTKPLAPVIPTSVLQTAKQQLSIPVCAIGGITLTNAPHLLQQGADMLAVVSDLWCSADITQQAQQYTALFTHQTAHYGTNA